MKNRFEQSIRKGLSQKIFYDSEFLYDFFLFQHVVKSNKTLHLSHEIGSFID